jgi:uncharacterized protein (DUF1810 family)
LTGTNTRSLQIQESCSDRAAVAPGLAIVYFHNCSTAETPMEQNADPFDLRRFVDAQAPVIEDALSELRAGRKRTHWMWFVFPQIEGLGFSSMAKRYAIRSPAEARAYLNHPVLGDRLRECIRLVVATSRPIAEVFSHPDRPEVQVMRDAIRRRRARRSRFLRGATRLPRRRGRLVDTRKACVAGSLRSAVGLGCVKTQWRLRR